MMMVMMGGLGFLAVWFVVEKRESVNAPTRMVKERVARLCTQSSKRLDKWFGSKEAPKAALHQDFGGRTKSLPHHGCPIRPETTAHFSWRVL